MASVTETKTVSSVLNGAEERLRIAYFGLEDMLTTARASAGLMNAVVFGRAVTFALQNLRSVRPDFDEWYEPKMQEMKSDPLLKYFADLRTTIEKTTENITSKGYALNFNSAQLAAEFGKPPPGAYMKFICDSLGRSGWRVKTSDGEIVEYYVSLPESMVRPVLFLAKAPQDYENMKATELVKIYLDKLTDLLKLARAHFEGA